MARKEFGKRVKAAAWKRCGGLCEGEGCGVKLQVGKFDYDHILADGLGGQPTLENCAVLCRACHDKKTHTQDTPIMRKADAQRDAHLGITRAKARIPQKPKMKREGKTPLPFKPLFKKAS